MPDANPHAGARWRRYLRFWGPNVDADIDDELGYHIDMRTQDFVARGLSPDEARVAARQLFGHPGDVARALRHHDLRQLHQSRRADMFQDLIQDVRYGLRQLRNAPRFTLAVVLVLALGIGANTAIFSAIDAAFLRPLPFADPSRLVIVEDVGLPYGGAIISHPGPSQQGVLIGDISSDRQTFSSVAAYATGGLNLVGGAEPVRATITYVTADFFTTLGRFPTVGRALAKEEFDVGGAKSIIISSGLAQRQFGGERPAIGHVVTLNDISYTVVGVMGRDFLFPAATDVWIPLALPWKTDVLAAFRNYLPAFILARLAPTATVIGAAQRVEALRRHFRPKISPTETSVADLVRPLQRTLVADRRTELLVLMASAALLLIIACANVTNLILVRASTRQRELAVRAVLGATRLRVLRQLIVESLLLSVGGGGVAMLVARVSIGALRAAMPTELASVAPPRLDARVFTFTILLSTVVSLVVGIWPALAASRPDLSDAITAGGWGATRRRGMAARSVLAVAEIALAVMLLVGAGLMIESFRKLIDTDTGLLPDHVVTARLAISGTRFRGGANAKFINDMAAQLRTAPGIAAAAVVSSLPMESVGGISLQITPEEAPADKSRASLAAYLLATPGYFSVIGAKLRGEDLPAVADTARRVVVINETMARKLWPGQNAIGRRLLFITGPRTVIGVVADIRTDALDVAPKGQMYLPISEMGVSYAAVVARGAADPRTMLTYLRTAVRAIDPTQPIYALFSMDDVIGASVAPRKTNTVLLVVFGVVALLLAGVGVYGVLSFGVAERTREIGVRVALGAQRGDVIGLVLGQGLALTGVGVVLGLAGAFALSRILSSILYEVSPHDLRVFVVAPLVLSAIALVAVVLPALRATRVDPMVALRRE